MEGNNEGSMLDALDRDENEDADWVETGESPDESDGNDEEHAQLRRSVDEG